MQLNFKNKTLKSPEKENKLTPEEKEILDLLALTYNKVIKLPVQHPMDNTEFAMNIHILQHLIMARVTRRIHKDIFLIQDDKPKG